jgi:hypothetical protein
VVVTDGADGPWLAEAKCEETVTLTLHDGFSLFAAYHLGLLPDGDYRFQNLHQLAARLGVSPAELQQALVATGLDADSVLASGFDLVTAQLEVMDADTSEGRLSIARRHYEAFRHLPPGSRRDWERELAEAAAENEQIFGPGGPGGRGGSGGTRVTRRYEATMEPADLGPFD